MAMSEKRQGGGGAGGVERELRSLGLRGPAPELRERVLAAVAAAEGHEGRMPSLSPLGWRFASEAWLAAAVLVLIVLTAVRGERPERSERALPDAVVTDCRAAGREPGDAECRRLLAARSGAVTLAGAREWDAALEPAGGTR